MPEGFRRDGRELAAIPASVLTPKEAGADTFHMNAPARFAALLVVAALLALGLGRASATADVTPAVKVAFIHHSVGQNWLDDDQGGLARALQARNFYVSDTNYGWGPDSIGDRTDIPDWLEWFTGPSHATYMSAVYALNEVNSPYSRTLPDPGGENRVVMFKSCFPNSSLTGSPSDGPDPAPGLTVGHAKYVYMQLLTYFSTRPDKLFIVVTAPPNSDASTAENARAFNNWLVHDWLAGYAGTNVAVFDFYNVLSGPANHHRNVDGVVQHVYTPGMNSAYYRTSDGDDHPNPTGSRKATEEFVPLLDFYYARWTASPAPVGPTPSEPTPSPSDGASPRAQPVALPARVVGVTARHKVRRLIVTWTATAANGYVLQVRAKGRAWRTAGQVGAVTRFVWRGAKSVAAYRVRVAALNASGRGAYSRAVRAAGVDR